MTEIGLDDLRSELADFAQPDKKVVRSAQEERIIAGFEEIQRFVEESGHAPRHGEEYDIFERLYAVRLDRLRQLEEYRSLLEPLDQQRLISGTESSFSVAAEPVDEDALAEELRAISGDGDITNLQYVSSRAEKRAAEEIANREQCKDFEIFKPLFEQLKNDLETGLRRTRKFVKDAGFLKADIEKGQFFILGGQTVFVAEVGETIKAPNGEFDARLRLVYSNGTESNLLRRSLQRALYKDDAGRRISEPSAGPLFDGTATDEDTESGTVYVLQSKSDMPDIAVNRNIIHKIGVTGGKVETRIANAKLDPTFLMADVEIVATYELYNINRTKLENLIHRFFLSARLDLDIADRFGNKIKPREWFLVPLSAINDAVEKIQDGTIANYRYDPETAALLKITN